MSRSTKLFETYKLGPITLANRLVMAPLTRNRAVPGTFVPVSYTHLTLPTILRV